MTHKLFGTSVAALMVVALLLTVGSVVAVAQVVASATGSGQIHVSGELRTFTFNAETDSSGVTTGQTETKSRSSGLRWHGTLDCLNVVGNVATMSGVVTDINSTTPPFVVGSNIVFQVIDNGEGANAPPDLISLTFFFGTGPPPGCTGFGIFATIPIEHGNVKVH
jgi:hypothetical protein